eukprot:TRINITY_DN3170_c0_g2_i2.p1 TRINITY_DN3170_c0_g2~~TRINITY_DN3170_c0_g2_i2.p1  ORF type:complete len:295 (+),score=27.08 TRINITY_DN3170_c0_g2_i2:513-1397(+)
MSLMIKLCIVFIQGGTAIVYLAFVRDYLKAISCEIGIQSTCTHDTYSLLFAMLIILPLSLITNFHFFSYVSIVASVLQMVIFVVLSGHHVTRLGSFAALSIANPESLRFTIGNFIFVFEGVPTIMEIRRSMQTPSSLPSVLGKVYVFASLVCFIFALLGYWAFGNETSSIILFNYDLARPLFFSLVFGYMLIILLSFPIQFFPILECMQSSQKFKDYIRDHSQLLFFRFLFVLFFAFCAFFIQSLDLAVNFIGAFFAGPISFIFPVSLVLRCLIEIDYDPVSYTHLTLPTIYSV